MSKDKLHRHSVVIAKDEATSYEKVNELPTDNADNSKNSISSKEFSCLGASYSDQLKTALEILGPTDCDMNKANDHNNVLDNEEMISGITKCKKTDLLPLEPYEIKVVLGVFTEVIEQLNIIKNYLPYPKFDWAKAYEDPDSYVLKICGKITEHVFPPYHEYEKSPLWKVQLDRFILQKIIEETRGEISTCGVYTVLANFLHTVDHVKKQEDIIVKENANLKKLVSDYKKILAPKMTYCTSENQIEEIFDTEDEMMLDERIKMGIEERYVEAWEKARVDQNTMLIIKEENGLGDKLEALSIAQKMENRINNEVTNFLLVELSKLEDSVTEWTNRYNKELEIEDTKIIQLNSEKESVENKMKTLLVKFHHQTEVIEELTKFFDDYQREEELHRKQVRAAALIQYWWRKYLAIKKAALAKARKAKKAKAAKKK